MQLTREEDILLQLLKRKDERSKEKEGTAAAAPPAAVLPAPAPAPTPAPAPAPPAVEPPVQHSPSSSPAVEDFVEPAVEPAEEHFVEPQPRVYMPNPASRGRSIAETLAARRQPGVNVGLRAPGLSRHWVGESLLSKTRTP